MSRAAVLLTMTGVATLALWACTGEAPFSNAVPRPINKKNYEEIVLPKILNDLMVKTFVALNWPANLDAGRGAAQDIPYPEAFSSDTSSPRVWETWKQDWELEGNIDRLSGWNEYSTDHPPCDELHFMDGQKKTVSMENWAALRQAHGEIIDKLNLVKEDSTLFAALAGPNIDSNGNPYHHAIFFNKSTYDCWKDGTGKGCINPQDRKGLCMPGADEENDGAIMVKASWRRLTEAEFRQGKYFARRLLVLEPGDGGRRICRERLMGLAALHVVYKHAYIERDRESPCSCDSEQCEDPVDRWIWATFEQPDDVPDCFRGTGFTHEPAPLQCAPFPAEAMVPSGECRATQIPSALDGQNETLATLPAPWKYYRMINRQWRQRDGNKPTHRVANVRLETYSQTSTCMGCHNHATQTDRIWSLSENASDLDGNPCLGRAVP